MRVISCVIHACKVWPEPILTSRLSSCLLYSEPKFQLRVDINDAKRSNVKLRASPVAALGVVLNDRRTSQYDIYIRTNQGGRTWILVSVFKRNHWGMGLDENPWFRNRRKIYAMTKTYRFWRPAFARMRFVLKDFWEGWGVDEIGIIPSKQFKAFLLTIGGSVVDVVDALRDYFCWWGIRFRVGRCRSHYRLCAPLTQISKNAPPKAR